MGVTPAKKIEIRLCENDYMVGTLASIEVIYANGKNREISFRDPAKTWEVMLHIIGEKDEILQRLPFGKIIRKTNHFGLIRTLKEDADTITLMPGKQYKFKYDIHPGFLYIFHPGKYTFVVVDRADDAVTYTSNKIEVPVYFKMDSIPNLLNIVSNGDYTYESRLFCLEWLKKFDPDLDLNFKEPDKEEIISNKTKIEKFKIWWEENKNNEEIAAKITNFNRLTGLK